MNFNDTMKYKGHLEIWKIFRDGRGELAYDEDNVICSGIGPVLASYMSASATAPITNFQVTLFQVGIGGAAGLQVSSNGTLGEPLSSLGQYGVGTLETVVHTLVASGQKNVNQRFGTIGQETIDKVGDTKVRWRIILDEQACNGETLNEIGLFGYNPTMETVPESYLVAYRTFADITKTSDFILDFRWTIEF